MVGPVSYKNIKLSVRHVNGYSDMWGFFWWVVFFFLSGADCMSSLRSPENQSGAKNQAPDSSSASERSSSTSKVRVTGITAVTS